MGDGGTLPDSTKERQRSDERRLSAAVIIQPQAHLAKVDEGCGFLGTITDPLRGNVWGSVFRDEDVTIGGPIDGAVAVADFHFDNVDVTDSLDSTSYLIDTVLPAGQYQILGFMDIDANSVDGPDVGDPVMIPIGAFELACAEQPVIAEFALLMPEEY